MDGFVSTAQLTNRKVTFRELKLSEYRQLLKCFLGDEIDPISIFNNTDQIFKNVTNLTLNEIKKLSFVDYFLLLFYIRQVSVGGNIQLLVFDNEQKQVKIDLNIQHLINEISSITSNNTLDAETIDNYKLQFRVPSLHELIYAQKETEQFVYAFFLKSLNTLNFNLNLEEFSYQEREEIFKNLPVKITTTLIKKTQQFTKILNNTNLLSKINNDKFTNTLPFLPNLEILGFITKLVYNASLENIYDYIFALAKVANLSSTFLDSCSPGEFYLFTKKLELLNAQQTQSSSQSNEASNSTKDELPPIVSEANFGLE
jgi:hypothetical protein